MPNPRETVRGPNCDYGFCKPDPYASESYGDDGWSSLKVGVILARAEVRTYQYKTEAYDMPLAGYHAVGVEGPNARANCGVSTSGISAKAEFSVGKITSDVGRMTTELSPNLTTAAQVGTNGVEFRISGTGASVNRKGIGIHTPIGSIGWRW